MELRLPLTTADLLRAAAEASFSVSESKLRRLARNGIFYRGRRGPGHGNAQERSANRYPMGADQFLIEICETMQQVHGLRSVGWALWWRGRPVEDKYWRTPLKQAAFSLDHHLLCLWRRGFSDHERMASDELFAAIDRLKEADIDEPIIRQVRNRLRDSGQFQTFMVTMLEAAVGRFEGFVRITTKDADAAANEQILRRGLGFQRAHRDRSPDGIVLLPKEAEADVPIASLSRSLRRKSIQTALRRATDGQIFKARDELRILIDILSIVGAHLEEQHGRNAFGLGSIQTVARSRHKHMQIMLLLWITTGEDSELRTNARDFLVVVTQLARHEPSREDCRETVIKDA
jgi:hypothetical protein